MSTNQTTENSSTVPLQPDEKHQKLIAGYSALSEVQQAALLEYLETGSIKAVETMVDADRPDYNQYNPITRRPVGSGSDTAPGYWRRCGWAMYGMLCVNGILEPANFDFQSEAEEKSIYAERLDDVITYLANAVRVLFDDSYGAGDE